MLSKAGSTKCRRTRILTVPGPQNRTGRVRRDPDPDVHSDADPDCDPDVQPSPVELAGECSRGCSQTGVITPSSLHPHLHVGVHDAVAGAEVLHGTSVGWR